MAQFLLSTHCVAGEAGEPMTEEEMQRSYQHISALEEEMRAAGALLASGRLEDSAAATVVRVSAGDVLTTDGPFTEAKEQLGGFYIIEAPDLEAALGWASKVTTAIASPIEVRAFAGWAGA